MILLGSVGYALARPYGGLPEGTVIGGVDVSGMSNEEAKQALQDHAGELLDRDLTIRAGSASLVLDVQHLNLAARVDEALANAKDNSTVIGRMRQRLGLADDRQVALRFTVDRKALENQLKPLSKQVDEPVAPAKVRLRDNGQFALQPGKGGLRMDRKVLVAALTDLPKTPDSIEVPIRRVQPAATTQSARNAAAAARKLLDTEHVIVLGRTREPIPRKTLAEAVTFINEGSRVRLRVARPPIEEFLHGVFGAAEKEPQNAQFAVNDDGSVNVVAEVDGRVADADAVSRALEEDPGRAEVPVQVVSRPATFTAADARQLGITDQIGSFTTQYIPGEPRVTNIQRAAETIDGTILQPGEAFDLNQRLGERTIEKGYVVAPMIDEGRLRDAVGGGVSQVATTVFNAAYLSGLEIVTHTPHEFWISRYPQGQEATVSWGGPELIFRNDWSAPLVLIANADAGSISRADLLPGPRPPRRDGHRPAARPEAGRDPRGRQQRARAGRRGGRAARRPGGLHRRLLAQGVARRRADPGRALLADLPSRGHHHREGPGAREAARGHDRHRPDGVRRDGPDRVGAAVRQRGPDSQPAARVVAGAGVERPRGDGKLGAAPTPRRSSARRSRRRRRCRGPARPGAPSRPSPRPAAATRTSRA